MLPLRGIAALNLPGLQRPLRPHMRSAQALMPHRRVRGGIRVPLPGTPS
jgi:hypothetical protein